MSGMHDKARVIVDRGDLAVLVRWAQPITGNKNAQAAIAAPAQYFRKLTATAQTQAKESDDAFITIGR